MPAVQHFISAIRAHESCGATEYLPAQDLRTCHLRGCARERTAPGRQPCSRRARERWARIHNWRTTRCGRARQRQRLIHSQRRRSPVAMRCRHRPTRVRHLWRHGWRRVMIVSRPSTYPHRRVSHGPPAPDIAPRSVLEAIGDIADRVVVMTSPRRSPDRVDSIDRPGRHHSARASGIRRRQAVHRVARPNRPQLLTWWLLGPGKVIGKPSSVGVLGGMRPSPATRSPSHHPKVFDAMLPSSTFADPLSCLSELRARSPSTILPRSRQLTRFVRQLSSFLPYDSLDQVTRACWRPIAADDP